MRILSLSLCVAAVACVAAQSVPGQAAFDSVGPQNFYSWAEDITPEELAIKTDELQEFTSEFAFRSKLIVSMTEPKDDAGFNAQTLDCDGVKDALTALMNSLIRMSETASTTPVIGITFKFMANAVTSLVEALMSDSITTGELRSLILPVDYAFDALKMTISAIPFVPSVTDFNPILNAIQDFDPIVITVAHCVENNPKVEVTPNYCDQIADFYRILVADASVNLPLTTTESEDLRRVLVGTRAILDASRNAISTQNSKLLTAQSIFTGELTREYRDALLNIPNLDEKYKTYARTELGMITGISNALEACVRVATDPAAAADDLEGELTGEE
ncbi:hypothetical protein BGZ83_006748 [Gryganskiella cystojenkinii]|nr:hypothetical protein BGZ83_006748 [Gryganskiella cystojenkinii]